MNSRVPLWDSEMLVVIPAHESELAKIYWGASSASLCDDVHNLNITSTGIPNDLLRCFKPDTLEVKELKP